MGAIVSRKKKTAVITSQSVPVITSQSTAHRETATSQPGNQASRSVLKQPISGSHDNENESHAEEKSEASDKSDSEPESNDDEKQSENNSARSASVSSRSNESVKEISITQERSETKPAADGASLDDEFTSAWRKTFLDDLDIKISDNVKIVRIFTSSTFTGEHGE